MTIRAYGPGDHEAWVRHLNLVRLAPLTPGAFLAREASWPSAMFRQRIVGLRDGRVAAIAQLAASPYAPADHLALTLVVDPPERRRGMGAALLLALAESAHGKGYAALLADIPEAEGTARRWLERRGFALHAHRFESVLALGAFDHGAHAQALARFAAQGVRFATMQGAGEARWRRLCRFFAARLSEAPDMRGLPPWSEARCREALRRNPAAEPDWIVVAEQGRRWLGVAIAHRMGAEGYAFFTGVAPAWRSLGLGRTLKGELIGRLRAHGIERLRTNNLNLNAAAIRMNEALAFRPTSGRLELRARIEAVRRLG